MKILVLGHKGMLGHMVLKYMQFKGIECYIINHRYPTTLFKNFIRSWEGAYIINCIGAIPQKCEKFFSVNYSLPIFLDTQAQCKIIHPGTDCEKDVFTYGATKKGASDWLKDYGRQTKIIKTSIIGPELNSNYGLLEWFLSQKKKVSGFSNVYWNGVTTHFWAKFSLALMVHWDKFDTETILASKCISKHELLKIIKQVYGKETKIGIRKRPKINKCLVGLNTKPIIEQLQEMREFYEKSK